ncbi:MAG: signal peptidase I [Saccharofermentans sp.]|nr:signal peptidase I [Saccharofermentans sp.]
MNENDLNNFSDEEITEFKADEFSFGDEAPVSSSTPVEEPVSVLFGDDKNEEIREEKLPEDLITEEPVKKDSRNEVLKEIFSWVRTIAIGVLVGVFLVVFVIQRDNVYGDSMKPTLYSGDMVYTLKIPTYTHNYNRGDIVILDGEDMEGYDREEYLIKRVIGLPGETVRIADGHVYIKEVGAAEFMLLEEPYLDESVQTLMMNIGIEKGYDEVTLGENEYYCLGDNRSVSKDSRVLGPFSEDRIKGTAIICIYPFEHFGLLK